MGESLGNFYSTLWPNSSSVALALGTEDKLSAVVADVNAHHAAIAHERNPTPVWLKDMLLNQWSHYHMLLWLRDGRMREYEAWSCDDMDSVHNDYQRHLLYLWGMPEARTPRRGQPLPHTACLMQTPCRPLASPTPSKPPPLVPPHRRRPHPHPASNVVFSSRCKRWRLGLPGR